MTVGVILAGGQARRMGGGDKCMLPIKGQPMLRHVIDRLAPQVSGMVLNANGEADRFDAFGVDVIADSVSGFAGPLAGVLAGMDWAAARGNKSIVSVAADTPFFPRDLVLRLQEHKSPSGLCMAASNNGGEVRNQPTFGLWPVELREDLREALRGGLRKIVQWTDRHGAGQAVWDGDPFFNINTPEDLAVAEGIAL